jgi:phospholipid-binding lipoprotein MlaA
MFTFNEKFDDWLLKPVAKGYDWLLPQPVKNGVGNFFSNLLEPRTVLNDLMQGKWVQSGRDTGRFVINSTVGILGVMDVAKNVGLETQPEDFGQSFAVWGVGEGPYFVWPIVGPRFLRETVGFGFDWVTNPVNWPSDQAVSWGLWAVDITDTRARFLPTDAVIERAAGDDKYIFIREAYRQRRRNLVYDGNPPKPKFFEEEPENNNNAAPAPAAPKSE